MAIQFGLGTMSMTPNQTGGSPDINTGPVDIGILQNVSLEFSFDFATLYGGSGLFPQDVRVHTGSINGSAESAELTALFFQLLTGGTLATTTVTLDTTDVGPSSFKLILLQTTDSISLTFTLNRCRSASFSTAMARDSHVIPGFQFQAFADGAGQIGTINTGDAS